MFTESSYSLIIPALLLFVFMLLVAMLLEILLQRFWIAKMRELKIRQVTKLYGPSWHEKAKAGTPTMGGVVFFPVLLFALLISRLMVYALEVGDIVRILSYPLLAAAVGFIDDWIKHSRRSSDGISSMQKLALQIIVTVPWAVWILPDGLPLWPDLIVPGFAGVAVLTFVGVGLQNAVNVTDGLDGLAVGCALISFFAALCFFCHDVYTFVPAAAACGICMGFLWHNANPASVFMGDVGAHFLAGLMVTLCVMSGMFICVIPLGFMFGLEIISVAVQITAIRGFKKKVFLMSPMHHHFEMLGWSETQIVTRFWVIHLVGLLITILCLFLFINLM